jgi:hypothetical protein
MSAPWFCLYFGRADECAECGGFNATGTQFCSHDCAASRAERVARQDADRQARRDREALFGAECERLRALGHSDEEIDALLVGIPT